ncbi:MAG: hypothetical protein AB7T06_11170 [Kofleriaceae bacterium]
MNTIAKLAAVAAVMSATGCIKDYEYEGEYEMTYNVVMSGAQAPIKALAGLSAVEIHEDAHEAFFVDLGATFCQLSATKGEVVDAFTEWPWLEIAAQPCWFSYGGATYALTVSGSATYHDDTERVSIDLAGTFLDDKTGERGTLTLRLDEHW